MKELKVDHDEAKTLDQALRHLMRSLAGKLARDPSEENKERLQMTMDLSKRVECILKEEW